MSIMENMENISKALGANMWELYNNLSIMYPSLEAECPSYIYKAREGAKEITTEASFSYTNYDFFEEEDFSIVPKSSTKRYNKRDKARAGRKGKKVNDAQGEHWTRIHMTNPKREKAMKKQVEMDLCNMENNKLLDKYTILSFAAALYSEVKTPCAKSPETVISEVMDSFSRYEIDLVPWVNDIWDEVKRCYLHDKELLDKYLSLYDEYMGESLKHIKTAKKYFNRAKAYRTAIREMGVEI